jgi:heme-degrading monooxygenase HmoA
MFIAMNRFKVAKGREADFEALWLNRETYLHELPGFVEFHLLKGPEGADHALYSTHTLWASYDDFDGWTKSEQFRKSHARAENREPLFLGHPQFEGFHILQTMNAAGERRVAAE